MLSACVINQSVTEIKSSFCSTKLFKIFIFQLFSKIKAALAILRKPRHFINVDTFLSTSLSVNFAVIIGLCTDLAHPNFMRKIIACAKDTMKIFTNNPREEHSMVNSLTYTSNFLWHLLRVFMFPLSFLVKRTGKIKLKQFKITKMWNMCFKFKSVSDIIKLFFNKYKPELNSLSLSVTKHNVSKTRNMTCLTNCFVHNNWLLIRFDGWKMWCWFIFIHFCTNYII